MDGLRDARSAAQRRIKIKPKSVTAVTQNGGGAPWPPPAATGVDEVAKQRACHILDISESDFDDIMSVKSYRSDEQEQEQPVSSSEAI